MASPSVVGTPTSGHSGGTASTSHTLSYPTGIQAGETLLAVMGYDVALNVADWSGAGWTEIKDFGTLSGSDAIMSVAWKKATGSESGTFTVSTGATSCRDAWVVMRISGAADPTVTPPVVSTGVTIANSATVDPDALTPAGGSKDYLWVALSTSSHGRTVTAYPTSYTHVQVTAGDNSGSAARRAVGVAGRQLTASSEDPGVFTHGTDALAEKAACTVAVYPTSGLTGALEQALETDTAQNLGGAKKATLEQTLETDTAQDLAASKKATLEQALETDTAQNLTWSKKATLDQALETDTAFDLSKAGQTAVLEQALETDTAQNLAGAKKATLDQALETDTAQNLAASKRATLEQALETDTAQDLAGSKKATLDQALETDTAQNLAGAKKTVLDQSSEADTAFDLVASKLARLDQAVEVETAQDLAASKKVTLDQAVETDTAFNLSTGPRTIVLEQAFELEIAADLDAKTARPQDWFEVSHGSMGLGHNRKRKQFAKGQGRVIR